MEEKKTCCFFGHRKITGGELLKEKLRTVLEDLIAQKNINVFLFGSKSEFDNLCREVLGELKEKYPQIRRVYIRAEYRHISEKYEKYLLESCDETYYAEKAINSGRAVYVLRNEEMIDKSDICVVYHKDGYLPARRKNNKRALVEFQPKSGTSVAYAYAMKKKKQILNLA